MIYKLSGPAARSAAIKAISVAPEGWMCRITEPNRSLEVNALLHAMLTDVSMQKEWAGGKQSTEIWKRLLIAAWMRATGRKVTLLPALDGQGFDALYQRSSQLTKSECSELIEYILAWGTDNNVIFGERYAALGKK